MENDYARQSASEERIKTLSKEVEERKKEEERLKIENENLLGKIQELADQNSLLKAQNATCNTNDLSFEIERLNLTLQEKDKIIAEMVNYLKLSYP